MKSRSLPVTLLVLLGWSLACATGKDSGKGGTTSTDETGTSSSSDTSPLITDFGIDWSGNAATLYVEVTGDVNKVSMEIDQTGDPSGTCGPAKGGLNDCGEWSESHAAFQDVGEVGEGGHRFELGLNVVNDFKKQVDDSTTLFAEEYAASLTVLVTVKGPDGADCGVSGEDPTFFAADCANVF